MLNLLKTAFLPSWAVATAVYPRTRPGWSRRVGWELPAVSPGVWWVHASSLGEVGAAEPLVLALSGPVLLTVDTEEGLARASQIALGSKGKVTAALRPMDHPWTLAPLWADARPCAVIFVEVGFWPALAGLARSAGVRVIRASVAAGAATRRLPWLQTYFRSDLLIARDAESAAFFRKWTSGRVCVGADLKGDRAVPAQTFAWRRPFVVAANVRPSEFAPVLNAFAGWRKEEPELGLLLAPRHLEELPWGTLPISAVRRSTFTTEVPPETAIVVLDTFGELAGAYAGARAAFIGGTFDSNVQGHSPAEAARAGVPVVHGPHIASQGSLFYDVKGTLCTDPADLLNAWKRAANRPVAAWSNGAVSTTLQAIATLGTLGRAPEAAPRPWLRPLVPVFGAVSKKNHRLHSRLPVWAVGSENARGPGKTSTVIWFAEQLRQRGFRPGVWVRGLGRPKRGAGRSWESDEWAELGDEGACIARRGLAVVACRRPQWAMELFDRHGCDVVLLDDGLGYPSDRRILVIDGRFPAARGPMPVGEFRGPAGEVDLRIAHFEPRPNAFFAARRSGPWRRGESLVEITGPVALFSAVARPQDFAATAGLPIARTRFGRDHQPIRYDLARELFDWAGELPLVVTEKDQVRFCHPWRDCVVWRAIELDIPDIPASFWPSSRADL